MHVVASRASLLQEERLSEAEGLLSVSIDEEASVDQNEDAVVG